MKVPYLFNKALLNESSDKLEEVLEGASEGKKTKGRTTNWDKPGGMNEADSDFDNLVDPDSIVPTVEVEDGKNKVKIRYGEKEEK